MIVLAQVALRHEYQVNYSLDFKGAPSGIIEYTTLHAIEAAKAIGTKVITFGSAAAPELQAVHNLSGSRVKLLRQAYIASTVNTDATFQILDMLYASNRRYNPLQFYLYILCTSLVLLSSYTCRGNLVLARDIHASELEVGPPPIDDLFIPPTCDAHRTVASHQLCLFPSNHLMLKAVVFTTLTKATAYDGLPTQH